MLKFGKSRSTTDDNAKSNSKNAPASGFGNATTRKYSTESNDPQVFPANPSVGKAEKLSLNDRKLVTFNRMFINFWKSCEFQSVDCYGDPILGGHSKSTSESRLLGISEQWLPAHISSGNEMSGEFCSYITGNNNLLGGKCEDSYMCRLDTQRDAIVALTSSEYYPPELLSRKLLKRQAASSRRMDVQQSAASIRLRQIEEQEKRSAADSETTGTSNNPIPSGPKQTSISPIQMPDLSGEKLTDYISEENYDDFGGEDYTYDYYADEDAEYTHDIDGTDDTF